MIEFNGRPVWANFPVMVRSPDESSDDRLVYVRRARPILGWSRAVLGVLVATIGVLLGLGVDPPGFMSVFCPLFGAMAGVSLVVGGIGLAGDTRLTLDKAEGRLVRSRRVLGVELTQMCTIAGAVTVNWSRQVRHSSRGTGGIREVVSFPVNLDVSAGGQSRRETLFIASEEDDARRLSRELGHFLGLDAGGQEA